MTNGNRPQGLARYVRTAGYRPRRRRTDAIVTGTLGFAVGAALGLGFFGIAAFIIWLAESIIDLIGYTPFLLALVVISGTTLAVSALRGRP